MRVTAKAAAFLLVMVFSFSAQAQPSSVDRVELELSNDEVRAPGLVGLTVRFFDDAGRVIDPRRLPRDWSVKVLRDGASVAVEFGAATEGVGIEGDLPVRTPGEHRYQVAIEDSGRLVAESGEATLRATSTLDFGLIRGGETKCLELPRGGRGLQAKVVSGELPEGLRVWGACLVAEDSLDDAEGSARVEIAVLSGSGQGRQIERRLYDINYRSESRLLTPRRVFFGVSITAFLSMLVGVTFAVRRRRPDFGPGAVLAWAGIQSTPYRGRRPSEWSCVDLALGEGKRGMVDVGLLAGGAALARGVLRVRPTEEGQVEILAPRSEEIHIRMPDERREVGRHRVVVPFGSTIAFRDVAVAFLIGDAANAAMRGDCSVMNDRSL